MKSLLKKLAVALGIQIIKIETYEKLIREKNKKVQINKDFFLDHFFHLITEQKFRPRVVYDVGANTGSWSKKCMTFFPEAKFFLFEPQISLKTHIEESLEEFQNYKLYLKGIGNINGNIPFTIHGREDSCSYSYSKEEATQRNFVQVDLEICRLDTIIKEEKIPPPDILKIDAEGMDIEVLEGCGNLIDETEIIMIEVGVMNKRIRNSVRETINFLDSKGFVFFDITDINRPFPNEVLWLAEFVFIRKDGLLDKNYNLYGPSN